MTPFQKLIKYSALALAACLILGIASGVLGLLTALAGIESLLEPGEEAGTAQSRTEFSDPIHILDMEIGAADIHIVTGSPLSVQTDNPYITVRESAGTLVIREERHVADLESSSLTLTIPEDLVFSKAAITTGAGRIEAEMLNCKRLELELGAGMAEFQQLTAQDRADIEGGAGKIVIHDGALRELDFDMGLGEADIVTALSGNAEISAGIGGLYLTVLGPESDYTVRAEQGIGRVEVEGTSVLGKQTLGSGPNLLEIEGGIGSITVDFED